MSMVSSAKYHPVMIGSCPYLQCYNNTHNGLYKLNLQQYYYYNSCNPFQEPPYNFTVTIGMSLMETPPQSLSSWDLIYWF